VIYQPEASLICRHEPALVTNSSYINSNHKTGFDRTSNQTNSIADLESLINALERDLNLVNSTDLSQIIINHFKHNINQNGSIHSSSLGQVANSLLNANGDLGVILNETNNSLNSDRLELLRPPGNQN
jgi:hypothetical protein